MRFHVDLDDVDLTRSSHQVSAGHGHAQRQSTLTVCRRKRCDGLDLDQADRHQ
jgi:hypothetical protein